MRVITRTGEYIRNQCKVLCFCILQFSCLFSVYSLNSLDQVELPEFQLIEHQEDWSKLMYLEGKQAEKSFWLRIKYIPLGNDAQNWIGFGAQMRDRIESWENFSFNPQNNATYNLWRFLPYADLHLGEDLRFFIELKSSLSSNRDLPGGIRVVDEDQFALQQAFVEIKAIEIAKTPLLFRLGRQEMAFGRYRLVTIAPWSNSFRNWDGVTVEYQTEHSKYTAFAAQKVQLEVDKFNSSSPNDRFFGLYSTHERELFHYDLYWLHRDHRNQTYQNNVVQPALIQATDNRHTLGLRLFNQRKEKVHYDLEGAYQLGRFNNQQVNAYMLGFYSSYQFEQMYKPQLYVFYDYASGGNDGSSFKTFNLLYPAGHAYLGFIDHIGRQNIQAPAIGFKMKPIDKLLLGSQYFKFYRVNNQEGVYRPSGALLRNGLGSTEKYVGDEIDLYAQINVNRHLQLLFGASRFYAGSFIKNTGPSSPISFAYSQVSIRV